MCCGGLDEILGQKRDVESEWMKVFSQYALFLMSHFSLVFLAKREGWQGRNSLARSTEIMPRTSLVPGGDKLMANTGDKSNITLSFQNRGQGKETTSYLRILITH